MVSVSGPAHFALNLSAQVFFVLFVWRMARRFSTVARMGQDRESADGGQNAERAVNRERDRLRNRSPEA